MLKRISLLALPLLLLLFAFRYQQRPVLYIIGDSTVKNGSGTGADKLWGWGSFLATYFDTTKIAVRNHAIGGRSSRTFITDGRWERIRQDLKKGDFVIMQFGHNDASPLDDTARARGTLKGIGNDSVETYNPIRKQQETVFSYGWYMRKMVKEAMARGAGVVICSPVPRNNFKDGKIQRGGGEYAGWAKSVAGQTGAWYIELNGLIADEYDRLGPDAVNKFFPTDHTHTEETGAKLNASLVVKGLKQLGACPIKSYLWP